MWHWNPFLIDPTIYSSVWAGLTNLIDSVVIFPDNLWADKQPQTVSRQMYFQLLQSEIMSKIGNCCIKSIEIRSHGNYGVGPFVANKGFPDQHERTFLEWLNSVRCVDSIISGDGITLKACACASDPDRLAMMQIMADVTGFTVTGWAEDYTFVGWGDKYAAVPGGGSPKKQ